MNFSFVQLPEKFSSQQLVSWLLESFLTIIELSLDFFSFYDSFITFFKHKKVARRLTVKKSVLKNFTKNSVRVSFLIKLPNKHLFIEHLRATASP